MTKNLKRFSLLLTLVFSSIFADSKADLEKYRLYVTKVDPEFHCFELSNNLVFNIPQKQWEIDTLPEVGSEIYIKPAMRRLDNRTVSKDERKFVVNYPQTPEKKPISVRISQDSEQYYLSYVSSETVCTQPAGWIFSEEYRDVILLSDGSRWIKENAGQAVFAPGDRVIVSKSSEDNFIIIDIDQSSYSFRCKTRASSGKMFKWHRFVQVKPYIPE